MDKTPKKRDITRSKKERNWSIIYYSNKTKNPKKERNGV
jgi:hypothetical protein